MQHLKLTYTKQDKWEFYPIYRNSSHRTLHMLCVADGDGDVVIKTKKIFFFNKKLEAVSSIITHQTGL